MLTNTTAATIAGGVTNAGTFIASGLVDVQVTNASTGTIVLNGGTTNTLNVNGTYQGAAGSLVTEDANFSNPKADQLIVSGLASGQLNVAVTPLDLWSTRGFMSSPLALASAAGGSTATYSVTGYPAQAGLVVYEPKTWTTGGRDYYGIANTIDGKAAGGLVSGFVSIQNAIATSFFRPANTFIVDPTNPAPNAVSIAPWIRVQGSSAHIATSGTAALTTGEQVSTPSSANVGYAGFETGLDAALLNVQGSGVALHGGVLAGKITGNSTQTEFPESTNFNDDFVGVYGALFSGPLFIDLQAREEQIGYTVNVNAPVLTVPNVGLSSQRFSLSGSASWAFTLADWSITPAAGLTYADAHTGNLNIPANPATTQVPASVAFGATPSLIGFAGLTVQKSFNTSADQVRLSPFVSVMAYHDFAGAISSSLTIAPGAANGAAFPVTVDRLSTFGAASFGVNGVYMPKLSTQSRVVAGSISADFQYGSQIHSAGATAQIRFDF